MSIGCVPTEEFKPAVPSKQDNLRPSPSWGFYQILWNQYQFTNSLERELDLLGGNPKHILFFRDLHLGRGFPTEIVKELADRQLHAVISLELTVWGDDKTDYLETINNGELDDFFFKWGQDAATLGEPVVLRFGFEMNGDWFNWGQRPHEFKKAWRRAHAQVERGSQGANNVQWMFCPNVLYDKKKPETFFEPYYPGDVYVDLIGLDGYNFGDHHSEWHQWQSYEEIFSESIDTLTANYPKPLWIAEIGCVEGPQKATWLRDALQRIGMDRRVETVIFFHYDKRREREHNWRLDSDSDSLRVFREWSGSLD